MSEALFPMHHCHVPFIPKVDFDFHGSCDILPAPDPIFDPPDVDLPIDNPPQPVIAQMMTYTLLGALPSGGETTATIAGKTVKIGDYDTTIPAGKSIAAGAKGWAHQYRQLTAGVAKLKYAVVTANKCPS